MTPGTSKSACALAFVLWAAILSHAQQALPQASQTATILGTVLDITGGTVPSATVVLQRANENRTLVTGDDGFFRFDGINAGTPILVLVAASGFKSWTSNEIILQSGQSFILTGVTLAVAPVEISVSAVTPEQMAAEQVKVEEKQSASSASYPIST
jgi:Carboxypeptidase regulatory-like domain